MKKYISLILLLLPVLLGLQSCGEKQEIPDPPVVHLHLEAPKVVETGSDFAVIEFNLSEDAKEKPGISDAGYCIAENENPSVNDKYVSVKESLSGAVNVTVPDLKSTTTYHIRVFAIDPDGETVYSDDISFITSEPSLEELLATYKGPEYLDYYLTLTSWNDRSRWNLSNVHDPTVMKADDGYYYMYQTDASYGNAHSGHGHFHGRRSRDLVNWEYLGATMKELPGWVIPKLNEIRTAMGLAPASPRPEDFGYWAPVARNLGNGTYRMYYSLVVPGYINGNNTWGERAFIGMMETNNPADNDSWIDKGFVITNSSDRNLNFNVSPTDWNNCYYRFNAIDPTYVMTPTGEHWLIYGSWHSGIAALQVDPATGKPVNELGLPWGKNASEIAAYGKCIYTRTKGNRWQGSEGPEVVYHDGYYYLFLAYDALDVPYNTRVLRSKNVDGPYLGINGADCTNGGEAYPIVTHPYKFSDNHGWVGISHCCVFNDGNDNWFFASQGRFPNKYNGNDYSNALMMGHVRALMWTEDGWPLVMPERYGAVPQAPIHESEIAGSWENISLTYSYGNQKTSSALTLLADNTVGAGLWKGTKWSYNEEKQILTVNGIKLYLRRECDWESSDRHHTIVYAGYNKTVTLWGKKIATSE